MNYGRLIAAALAAAVFDMAYGFVVYGMLLANQFAAYPSVYRPADDMSHMPVLTAGIFIGALVAAYIYAKGYEGGSGAGEGLRFGVALGAFVGGYSTLVNWAVLNIGRTLALSMVAVAFVEWTVIGLIIGLVYKPAAAAARRAAGV
jgi:hypothetical protein